MRECLSRRCGKGFSLFRLAAREERENVMTDIVVKERCVTEDTVERLSLGSNLRVAPRVRRKERMSRGQCAKGFENVTG